MSDLQAAAQQALEAQKALLSLVEAPSPWEWDAAKTRAAARASIVALEAALAEPVQEPDLSRCPQCGGPADNGHDRSIPPNPYWCTKCMVEPVPDSKHATIAEWWADKQRKPPATIDEIFDRMNKAPKGVFYGHDPMTIWMEAWRAAEQHGIKDA